MRIRSPSRGPAGPLLAALIAGVATSLWVASAGADVQLYEVTVPLPGKSAEDRAAAMLEALRAAAVQASGRREAATSPAISAADPARYAQRYSVTDDMMLKVGFDGAAIQLLLQQAGLPVWPTERPVTVVRAPGADASALDAAARWRGLPITVTAADAVADGARAVLSGVPSGAVFDWTFAYDGRTTVARGAEANGIDLAADTLAARYAPPSTRASNPTTIRVGGMDSLADYAGLLDYLQSLSLVSAVEVESLEGDVVRVRMMLRGDRELLARIAALDGRLASGPEPTEEAPPAVDFVYQP